MNNLHLEKRKRLRGTTNCEEKITIIHRSYLVDRPIYTLFQICYEKEELISLSKFTASYDPIRTHLSECIILLYTVLYVLNLQKIL